MNLIAKRVLACSWALILEISVSAAAPSSSPAGSSGHGSHAVSYKHFDVPEGPWSINVVTLDRSNQNYELQSALARGNKLGLATLSEQIRAMPPDLGRPVAGINGDFFRRQEPYLGDPKGLQIVRGELVSSPCDWSCFWVDEQGSPHITNVISRLEVIWPNGAKTPIGLNEPRARDGAVLYTAVVGSTTQTTSGRELVLEAAGTNAWLPLRPAITYSARVREVREGGNTPVTADTMVLSLGHQTHDVPAVTPGTVFQVSTDTWPELKGVNTAIGGGPAIVRNGKVIDRSDANVRHPRAAVGWNKEVRFPGGSGRAATRGLGWHDAARTGRGHR